MRQKKFYFIELGLRFIMLPNRRVWDGVVCSLSSEPTGHGSSVRSISASYASVSEISPHARHILSDSLKLFWSSADSRRASCQFLMKEWALNTDKLPQGGLSRNRVVKVTDRLDMASGVCHGLKAKNQINKHLLNQWVDFKHACNYAFLFCLVYIL